MELEKIRGSTLNFHVLLLHCCRRRYPDQPFCVRLQERSSDTFSRYGQGEVIMRGHWPQLVLSAYTRRKDVDRRIIYIPQGRGLPSHITKFHTIFISQHGNRERHPVKLCKPHNSERRMKWWDEGSQTLTMGSGTAIVGIETDDSPFLMALTVATDKPDTMNLDVQLKKKPGYSQNWLELDGALFKISAAHTDTYSGQLSPKHQLDIRLRKGSELGEGCWYVDINITPCKPKVPDKSQAHGNPPDNDRPSKGRRFKDIFSKS